VTGRRVGWLLNAALRLSILSFLVEVLLHPDDPRFAGKAIPVRNAVIVVGAGLLFPALHLLRRRWPAYPVWTDDLFLSIFWLDMAGNSFDFYDRYDHFDLIPHAHGTGAAAVVLADAFALSATRAVVYANVIHAALELQENLTDVFLGTHNVRGPWDTLNDMAVGLLGSLAYPLARRVAGR
jgi:hypothetical protein